MTAREHDIIRAREQRLATISAASCLDSKLGSKLPREEEESMRDHSEPLINRYLRDNLLAEAKLPIG